MTCWWSIIICYCKFNQIYSRFEFIFLNKVYWIPIMRNIKIWIIVIICILLLTAFFPYRLFIPCNKCKNKTIPIHITIDDESKRRLLGNIQCFIYGWMVNYFTKRSTSKVPFKIWRINSTNKNSLLLTIWLAWNCNIA